MGVTLAEKAYNAYGDAVGWRNWQGQPMPLWPELPEKIHDAWLAAIKAVTT